MGMRVFLSVISVLVFCTRLFAATLLVGPGEDFKSPHEAMKAVANGDTILINEGTYEFDNAIYLSDLVGVTISGNGDVQLLCSNMNDNVFWITGCHGVTVRDVRARHTNPTEDERCYGNVFGIDSSDDILITNCEIHGCGAIGVYVYNSDRVELRDNHIHDNWLWAAQFEGEGVISEDHAIEGLVMEGNILERNGCQEGSVYADGFTIASFIGVGEDDYIYFILKDPEQDDTLRFLVSDDCEVCAEILQDPRGYKGETMEIEWEEVGAIIPGTEECVRMKRVVSILVLP